VRDNIESEVILGAFGLITSFPIERFEIKSLPKKFDIPGANE